MNLAPVPFNPLAEPDTERDLSACSAGSTPPASKQKLFRLPTLHTSAGGICSSETQPCYLPPLLKCITIIHLLLASFQRPPPVASPTDGQMGFVSPYGVRATSACARAGVCVRERQIDGDTERETESGCVCMCRHADAQECAHVRGGAVTNETAGAQAEGGEREGGADRAGEERRGLLGSGRGRGAAGPAAAAP